MSPESVIDVGRQVLLHRLTTRARFLGELAALVDSDDWGPEIDALLE